MGTVYPATPLAKTIPNSGRMSRFFQDTRTGKADTGQSCREREGIPDGIREASLPWGMKGRESDQSHRTVVEFLLGRPSKYPQTKV